MICLLPELLTSRVGDRSSLHSVVDHILYAVERIGYQHVGIGSDFDGMLEGPEGADDVTCYPALVSELLRRGMGEDNVKAVIGLNIIRVMAKVEMVAQQEQCKSTVPLRDELEAVWTSTQKDMIVEQGRKRKLNSLAGEGEGLGAC